MNEAQTIFLWCLINQNLNEEANIGHGIVCCAAVHKGSFFLLLFNFFYSEIDYLETSTIKLMRIPTTYFNTFLRYKYI